MSRIHSTAARELLHDAALQIVCVQYHLSAVVIIVLIGHVHIVRFEILRQKRKQHRLLSCSRPFLVAGDLLEVQCLRGISSRKYTGQMRAGEVMGTVQAISIVPEGPEFFNHAR